MEFNLLAITAHRNNFYTNLKIKKLGISFFDNNLTIIIKNSYIDELIINPSGKQNVSVHLISSLIGKRTIDGYPSNNIEYKLAGEFDLEEFMIIKFP